MIVKEILVLSRRNLILKGLFDAKNGYYEGAYLPKYTFMPQKRVSRANLRRIADQILCCTIELLRSDPGYRINDYFEKKIYRDKRSIAFG